MTTATVDHKRIANHAKRNRWGATAIAKETGMSRPNVHFILAGKITPSAVTLKKICDAIGLPIEDAFVETEERIAA